MAPISVRLGTARSSRLEVNGFRVSDLRFPPLLRLGPHGHERPCVAVVLEGRVDKFFGARGLPSSTATLVTMPAGERHEDRFAGAGARIVVVEPERELPGLDSVRHFASSDAVWIADRIAAELEQPDTLSPLAVEGLALELLATALRLPPTLPTRAPPPWLARARDLLHDRFAETLRLPEVAAAVGVHPVHLARVFRAHYGLTPGAYVRHLRLLWAAGELAGSDLPLALVAAEAGFADQSHFTRVFKQATGLTPGQYRRLRR